MHAVMGQNMCFSEEFKLSGQIVKHTNETALLHEQLYTCFPLYKYLSFLLTNGVMINAATEHETDYKAQ